MKYKVTLTSVKPARFYRSPEEVTLLEGDTLVGYGYPVVEGKYLDIWFNPQKELDPENFVTLGRVNSKEGEVYKTKLSSFKLEVI